MTYKLTSTSQPADPYYGAVSLLLHGDGTNGSTTIVDSSPSPKTVTAFGNAQISTAQSKFGGASIAFNASGDYLTTADSADFHLSGDFTIETFLYANSFGSIVYLCGQFQTSDFAPILLFFTGYGSPALAVSTNNVNWAINVTPAGGALATLTWHHLAWVRNGNRWSIYVNGVERVVAANNSTVPYNSSGPLKISGHPITNNYPLDGYIDDFRITKGVARYTANFTPPTQPFKTLSENFGIVNDNSLKLYLDVGNDASYVGSGTTWNDLSGLRADLGLKGNFNTGTISTGIVTSFVGVATALGNIGITTTEITGINTTSVDIDQTLKEFSGIIGSGTTVTSIGISTVYINPATLNTDTLVAEISFGSYISTTSIGATFGNLFNDRYLNFDGESNYVYGSTAPLANATQGTIGAWINTFKPVDNFIDVVTVFDGDVGITTTEITGITTTGINVGDYLKPTINVIGSGTTVTSIGIGTVYINPATSNASSLTNAVLSFGYYSGGHIYGESLPGSDTYWAQFRLDDGYPSLIIDDDNVLPSAASTIRVDDGRWHYVAATGDGTNWSFYVDGVYNSPTFSQGDGTYWFNDASGLTTYTIGALDRINKTNYFNGKIAQVHVYDRALSQSEILQNYNAHQSRFLSTYYGIIIDGLVLNLDAGNPASYPGSGSTWFDLSNSQINATIVGSPVYTLDPGYFDITSDSTYISLSNTGLVPRTNDFTYSMWVNFDAFDTYDTLFENGSWTDSLLFRHESNNGIRVYAEGALRGTFSWVATAGIWYNIVFKRESGTCSLYVNNVSTGTPFTMTTDINLANNTMILMRSQHASGQFTNGKILQFLIYNKALTAAEISQNFNVLRSRYGL